MAPIAASITVSWTSNYAGQHRVCWRLGSSGAYDCSTVVSCTGGGATCSVTIPVTVDNESCEDSVFEGYVQATCEDVSSTNGRIPFSVNFVPSPTCLGVNITCTNVELAEITITNAGSGYVGAPTISFTGGGGSGATATAVVGTGGVSTMLITNPGSGGVTGPITYSNVAANALTGVGVGDFDVTVTGGVISGVVPSSPGTGYVGGDTFSFTSGDIGGVTGSVITVVTVDTGTIIEVTLTDPGSGYTSQPTIVFSSGTAAATAILAPCPDAWLAGNNCLGDAYDAYPITPALGQTFNICNIGGEDPETIPSEYTVDTTTDCCYDCVNIQITYNNPGGNDVSYAYIDCNPLNATYRNWVTDTISDGDVVSINCVVSNSYAFSSATGISVVTSASTC